MTFESKIGWLRSIVSFAITVLFIWVLRKPQTAYGGALWATIVLSLQFAFLKMIALIEKRHKLKPLQQEAAG